eukprot:1890255-Prymnesium_polylepis.1
MCLVRRGGRRLLQNGQHGLRRVQREDEPDSIWSQHTSHLVRHRGAIFLPIVGADHSIDRGLIDDDVHTAGAKTE